MISSVNFWEFILREEKLYELKKQYWNWEIAYSELLFYFKRLWINWDRINFLHYSIWALVSNVKSVIKNVV